MQKRVTKNARTHPTAAVVGDKDPTIADPPIEVLDVELTERCNQSCCHCYIALPSADSHSTSREMDADFFCAVFKAARKLGCSNIRFTGGEPLLRADFAQIYASAHDDGIDVAVSTNGTLITESIADLWVKKRPVAITVSIYGWDARSYDSITRVPGSYERFLFGLGRLRERDLPFRLRYPPIPALINNGQAIRKVADDLGATSVPYSWELTLHAYNDPAISARLRSLRISPQQAAQEKLNEPGGREHQLEKLKQGLDTEYSDQLFHCPGARTRPAVNAYGQLQPCLAVRHPQLMFDLLSGSLQEGLTDHFAMLRRLHVVDRHHLDRCGQCVIRSICGICPAASWTEHGDLTTPVEYFCDIAHCEARLLGFLQDEEKGWEVAPQREALKRRLARSESEEAP